MISRWNYDNTIKRDYSHPKIYLIFRSTLYSQRLIYLGQAVLKGTFTALDEIYPTVFYICTGRSLIGFLFKGGRIFEVIWVFVSSTWSSKITVTKEKRKIEEKERKRREKKTMVGLLVETQKNTCGTQLWKRKLTVDRVCKKLSKDRPILNNCYQLYISQFQLRPPPPPRTDPWVLAFFCLGWQIPGGGDSWAVKSPGVGTIFRFNYPFPL